MTLRHKKETTDLWRALRFQGFTIRHTRGNHVRIDHPNLPMPVFAPATPSDHRSLANVRAKLRRAMRKPLDNHCQTKT